MHLMRAMLKPPVRSHTEMETRLEGAYITKTSFDAYHRNKTNSFRGVCFQHLR